MKTMIKILAVLMASAAPALASGTNDLHDCSLLVCLFLGFGAIIVVFQLMPGMALFVTMIKELFSPARKRAPLAK